MDAGLILHISCGRRFDRMYHIVVACKEQNDGVVLSDVEYIRNCVNSRGNHASSCRMGSVCKSGRVSVDSDSDLLWNSLFVFCDMPGIGAYAKGK